MDQNWFYAINDFARSTPWLHAFMAGYALWGGLVALAVMLIIGWLWARRQPDAARRVTVALLTGVSSVVVVVVNQRLISPAIARPRPCHVLPHVETLLACKSDYSMPSDHSIIAGAFLLGMWFLNRKFGIIATILALVLAFSRVYVGVHYPSDTIVGLVVGAIIALVIILALRRPVTALATRMTRTPLRTLITSARPAVRMHSL